MQAAVLAAMPAMATALRRLLGGLHADKAAPGVDAMLLRLYRPLLFRGLAAANAAVRRNVLQLLLAAFPLQAWPQLQCPLRYGTLHIAVLANDELHCGTPVCTAL